MSAELQSRPAAVDRDALLSAMEGHAAEGLVETIVAALTVQPPTALARATALAAWRVAHEAEYGRRQHGGDRRSTAYRERIKIQTLDFETIVEQRTGLRRSAVHLDIKLAGDLGPRDIARLWDTRHADNAQALRQYAALDPVDRATVWELIAADGTLPMSQVLRQAGIGEAVDEQSRLERAIVSLFARLTHGSRRHLARILMRDDAFRTAAAEYLAQGHDGDGQAQAA